ncbi:MAG: IS1595 family transposase, partial [Gammaproteobacteria bacterium]|nr:IS1595 family transposase [Gammaproteobacteria bacterium]
MNKIQFQKGMSFDEFHKNYGTVEQCEGAVVKSRWPGGFSCSRCDGTRASVTHNGWRLWECLGCGYQCSSVAGTIGQPPKLQPTTWCLAMFCMHQSQNPIAALGLMRMVGVSYKTAGTLKHKLLEVMVQREAPRRLIGRVELDDAYLGGEHEGKPGRGSENKVPFVAAVQTNAKGNPIAVRLDRVKAFTSEEIEAWSKEALDTSAAVISDGLGYFRAVTKTAESHESIITGSGRKAVKKPEFHWVNTVLGNLKTALSGTYHGFKFK